MGVWALGELEELGLLLSLLGRRGVGGAGARTSSRPPAGPPGSRRERHPGWTSTSSAVIVHSGVGRAVALT